MVRTETQIQWEPVALEKYNNMLRRIPIFHRDIARKVVLDRANINAKDRGSSQINENDLAQAFLTEVPKAFYSLMIRIMDEVGLDYKSHQSIT